MKFYRTLRPFKLISFDLDDTLYDNSDVIRLAEENFIEKLNLKVNWISHRKNGERGSNVSNSSILCCVKMWLLGVLKPCTNS